MNKASLKKILKKPSQEIKSSPKEVLLNAISEELNGIGMLTVGVSYSKNDDFEFLELYSKIAKNRREHLKREINRRERKNHLAKITAS